MSDPTIERIEAELRESRTQAWDVETFLANRHRAKIEALEKPRSAWGRRWEVTKQITSMLYLGYFILLAGALFGVKLATKECPAPAYVQTIDSQSGLPLPPSAPPVYRVTRP